jgi:methylamine dehydrogenase accessory protein MauD
MTAWLLLNSMGLAIVSVILYLVLRQLGFVLHRVGPPGARGGVDGPRIGENIQHAFPDVVRRLRQRPRLIVFVAEACSICGAVKAGAQELARTWRQDADILLVYDCESAEQSSSSLVEQAPGLYSIQDCNLRLALGVRFVPYGLVSDASGYVVGKGLVNEISHLESLLELERAKSQTPVDIGAGMSADHV